MLATKQAYQMDFAQAVLDPSAGFGTPEAVRDHPELLR